MIQLISYIYGTIALEEFTAQEIQFSLIEDDHICKSIISTYHQIQFFRKENIYNPPKFTDGKMQIRGGSEMHKHTAKGWQSQIRARAGEGVGTPDPSSYHISL